MNILKDKIVVYDGSCSLCTGLYDIVTKAGIVKASNCKAYFDMPEHLQSKIEEDRFKNEMALIDIGNKPTSYGLDGIIIILSDKWNFLQEIFKIRWLYHLLWFLYKTVARNRFILFPPKPNNGIRCSCEPPFSLKYRIAYIIITMMITISTIGFLVDVTLIRTIGLIWALQLIISLIILSRSAALDYIGNLGTIMTGGALILLPGIFYSLIIDNSQSTFLLVNGLISILFMLNQYIKRVRYLQLSKSWIMHGIIILSVTASIINYLTS
ncbi:MAG: DUF393 domain-containing protein [Bacteroidia bacterium]|nr:DUF393 domain-containing protein [Bacteroidia bacterium]